MHETKLHAFASTAHTELRGVWLVWYYGMSRLSDVEGGTDVMGSFVKRWAGVFVNFVQIRCFTYIY